MNICHENSDKVARYLWWTRLWLKRLYGCKIIHSPSPTKIHKLFSTQSRMNSSWPYIVAKSHFSSLLTQSKDGAREEESGTFWYGTKNQAFFPFIFIDESCMCFPHWILIWTWVSVDVQGKGPPRDYSRSSWLKKIKQLLHAMCGKYENYRRFADTRYRGQSQKWCHNLCSESFRVGFIMNRS